VLMCSGKVYHELAKLRTKTETDDVAIVRVEQFYPFPEEQVRRALGRYRKAEEYLWVQEESQNMGGWSFMEPRLREMGYAPEYVGRDASASPATGSHEVHNREQAELVEAAIRGEAPHLVRALNPVRPRLTELASSNGAHYDEKAAAPSTK
jgi:2-oxoglutarate dehydrogenase E1 component